MPYIIDGHNLIPKIPGLSLENFDDESQLIELLLEFCRLRRKQVEVFFDKAPAGSVRARNFGAVIARFIREGQTADEAIRSRLSRLANQARNWTVVSSDQALQASARRARAHSISSEAFAQELLDALEESRPDGEKRPETQLSSEEVERWLEMFRAAKRGDPRQGPEGK
jgi:hypothetical protein